MRCSPRACGDVPASRDLVAQLPLTLTFRDFNAVEKIFRLPRKLSMEGVPAGDDPAPRDIGYDAPTSTTATSGYLPGIVRPGEFDGSVDVIESEAWRVRRDGRARRWRMTSGFDPFAAIPTTAVHTAVGACIVRT